MTMRAQYQAGIEYSGWACRHCKWQWIHNGGRHRAHPHYAKTYARFVWHKLTNWRCKPFSYRVDGTVPLATAWTVYQTAGNTWYMVWNGDTKGRIA